MERPAVKYESGEIDTRGYLSNEMRASTQNLFGEGFILDVFTAALKCPF